MILDFDIPTKEIERRKQVIRDIWIFLTEYRGLGSTEIQFL